MQQLRRSRACVQPTRHRDDCRRAIRPPHDAPVEVGVGEPSPHAARRTAIPDMAALARQPLATAGHRRHRRSFWPTGLACAVACRAALGRGNGLYCYVTLNAGENPTGDLERDLKQWVRKQIGPICYPDVIQFAPGLPKTRSGKIMRRILRKIAANEPDNLGDTTTLAYPSVVTSLVENRQNKD